MYCKISANKDNLQKENILSAIRILVADDSRELALQYEYEALAQKELHKTDRKTLKELVEKIKITKSEAEKRELSIQIAKLNKKIKTVSVSNFVNLSLETKQYISAVKLLEKLIIADRTVIEELTDLTADYEKFRESQLGADIAEISHYVFKRVKESETTMTAAADIFDIVKSDFKKYLQGTGKLSLKQILATSREYYKDLAEQAKTKQTLAERIEQSQTGIKLLKEYENGLAMYELLPSPDGNGGHLSLTFEADEMGNCIGSEKYYTSRIGKEGERFFSLRSPNEDGILEPHCTIHLTSYGKLAEIKGKSNGNVKFPYILAVRHFIKEYLGYDIENTDSRHRIRWRELDNIGYFDGFDIYNLPADGAELRYLNLYSGDYKYIDFSCISVTDILIIQDKFTEKDFQELSKMRGISRFCIDAPVIDDIEQKTFNELDNKVKDLIMFKKKIPVNLINIITELKSSKVVIYEIDLIELKKRKDYHGHENIIADVIINSLNRGTLELNSFYGDTIVGLRKELIDALNQKQNMLDATWENYNWFGLVKLLVAVDICPELFPELKPTLHAAMEKARIPRIK